MCLILAALAGVGSRDAAAANKTWDGGGADSQWITPANWDLNTAPAATDDVFFGSAFTSGTAITLGGNTSVNSATIDTATSFGITAGRFDLTTGNFIRTAASSGTQTVWSNMRQVAAARGPSTGLAPCR